LLHSRTDFSYHVTIVTDACDVHFEDGNDSAAILCNVVFYTVTHAIVRRVRSSHGATERSGMVAAIPEKTEADMASDPIRILIVNDDEDVLIALERLLEGEGYNTATAWSGKEALDLSRKSRFDLLLVDEHLSDVDAAVLWEALQRHQPNAFRFLMLSRKGVYRHSVGTNHSTVCKWEHADVTSKIRSCLAA
jgi:PleD family two-component response regulator